MSFIVETRNICKRFGKVEALDNVTLQLKENEILALLGDNGAGKSTLIKILAGALKKDSGDILVEGEKIEIEDPMHAKNLGIEVVYQDLALINCLNVYQNLFLAREIKKKFGFIKVLNKKAMEKQSGEKLAELGVNVKNLRAWVSKLSGGQRQSIAVAKAASFGKKIVILDEPTAALGVKESKHVLEIVKKLKVQGASIIIITHNMEHAFTVADRFFVLRLGRKVGVKEKSETNIDEIVKMITGGVFVQNNILNYNS
jgi:ABC-type sugar transport system ATPase subunit